MTKEDQEGKTVSKNLEETIESPIENEVENQESTIDQAKSPVLETGTDESEDSDNSLDDRESPSEDDTKRTSTETSDPNLLSKKQSDVIFAGVTKQMFDQLTNKNQQFMVSLDRQLDGELHYQVQEKVFKEIAETLIQGQSQSQTAKQVYGTPTELAQVIRDQELHPENEDTAKRSSDMMLGIDGALFLGSLFTFVTGMSMMMRNPNENGAMVGILSIIVNYILAGFSMLATAKSLPNPNAPKGKKGYPKYFLVSVFSMFAWFILVSMSSVVLPEVINPVFPGYIYMILGALTFALRFYVKRRYNIKGGLF